MLLKCMNSSLKKWSNKRPLEQHCNLLSIFESDSGLKRLYNNKVCEYKYVNTAVSICLFFCSVRLKLDS